MIDLHEKRNYAFGTLAKSYRMTQQGFRRRKNFGEDERTIILDFIQKNVHILEDKNGHPKNHEQKKQKWKELAANLEAAGCERDWKDVRAAYQRWKGLAKKSIFMYKQEVKLSSGNTTMPKPSETDLLLQKLCPEDFAFDESQESNEDLDEQNEEFSSEITVEEDYKYSLDPVTGNFVPVKNLDEESPHRSLDSSSTISRKPVKKRMKMDVTLQIENLQNLEIEKLKDEIKFLREEHEAKMRCLALERKLKEQELTFALEEGHMRAQLLQLQMKHLKNSEQQIL